MATAHSTRRKDNSSSRPQNRGVSAVSPARRYPTSSTPRTRKRPTAHARRASNTTLIPQLRQIAHLLRVVYSSCVTAELALQAQNADRDPDIRCTLHMNVSDPISRQVESLDALLVDLDRS